MKPKHHAPRQPSPAEIARQSREAIDARYGMARMGVQPPKPVTLPKRTFLEPKDGE